MIVKHSRRRSTQRRISTLEKAHSVLRAIVEGRQDPYEGYREVYAMYIDSSGIVEELKPLFRLPGIEPDGFIHVDEDFRWAIQAAAAEWLQKNPDQGHGLILGPSLPLF